MADKASPSSALGYITRAGHDLGLAAWLGGSLFGKLAFNSAVPLIPAETDRGKVTNAGYGAYNPVNTLAHIAAAAGWVAARGTETRPDKLTGTERTLATVKDALMSVGAVTGGATAVQHLRLARQAPEGAVPIEAPTTPAADTPAAAAKIQRSLGPLTTANLLAAVGIVAVNAVMAQIEHSRPPLRRALFRRAS